MWATTIWVSWMDPPSVAKVSPKFLPRRTPADLLMLSLFILKMGPHPRVFDLSTTADKELCMPQRNLHETLKQFHQQPIPPHLTRHHAVGKTRRAPGDPVAALKDHLHFEPTPHPAPHAFAVPL